MIYYKERKKIWIVRLLVAAMERLISNELVTYTLFHKLLPQACNCKPELSEVKKLFVFKVSLPTLHRVLSIPIKSPVLSSAKMSLKDDVKFSPDLLANCSWKNTREFSWARLSQNHGARKRRNGYVCVCIMQQSILHREITWLVIENKLFKEQKFMRVSLPLFHFH